MPITSSAKKAHRVSLRKQVFNLRRSRTMKEAIKEVKNLATSGKAKEAAEGLKSAYKAIDKAAKRGILKENTAARRKSYLARIVEKATKKK